MLPGIDGFEILKRLRQQARTPVLMLTARGEDVDRIVGLELGADDYLAKPFNPRELLARIKAILRRSEGTVNRGRIEVNGVALDPATRQVHTDGQPIELTTLEFDILEQLMRSAGRALSRCVDGEPVRPQGDTVRPLHRHARQPSAQEDRRQSHQNDSRRRISIRAFVRRRCARVSLFAKILLWFFATAVITMTAVVITTALTFTAPEDRQSPFTMMMNARLEGAIFAYEHGGPARLADSLERFAHAPERRPS